MTRRLKFNIPPGDDSLHNANRAGISLFLPINARDTTPSACLYDVPTTFDYLSRVSQYSRANNTWARVTPVGDVEMARPIPDLFGLYAL